jgi:hypothetical protein
MEYGVPTISVEIEGMSKSLILDTGSNISNLQRGISRCNVQVTTVEPYGVTGNILDIRGQRSVTLWLKGSEFSHSFLVCPLPTTAAGLLGTNFLDRISAIVDFECGEKSLTGIDEMPCVYSIPPTKHAALTVFSEGKAGRNPPSKKQEALHVDERLPVPRKIILGL